jgi:hypothetical protein
MVPRALLNERTRPVLAPVSAAIIAAAAGLPAAGGSARRTSLGTAFPRRALHFVAMLFPGLNDVDMAGFFRPEEFRHIGVFTLFNNVLYRFPHGLWLHPRLRHGSRGWSLLGGSRIFGSEFLGF